jgi:hypothetical protein
MHHYKPIATNAFWLATNAFWLATNAFWLVYNLQYFLQLRCWYKLLKNLTSGCGSVAKTLNYMDATGNLGLHRSKVRYASTNPTNT